MKRAFLVPIDLTKNELQNAIIQNLATAPTDPKEGQVYVNTNDHTLNVYLNLSWVNWIKTSEKGSANGVASLDSSSLVIQDPANATETPTGGKIVKSKLSGKIDTGWLETGSRKSD